MEKNIIKNYKIENKKTLNEQVYNSLKQMIIDDVFEPNQKLNEEYIGELLGVSATPVREAFRQLDSEGFVEIIPYKGVYVRFYTIEELKEVYECREVLEILALELGFKNITCLEIEELISRIDINKEQEDVNLSVETSNYIHDFLIDKSGNNRIKKLIDSMSDVLLRDRNISAFDEVRKDQIYQEHMEILNYIKNKNLPKAKESLSRHIKNGYRYILEQEENHNNKI